MWLIHENIQARPLHTLKSNNTHAILLDYLPFVRKTCCYDNFITSLYCRDGKRKAAGTEIPTSVTTNNIFGGFFMTWALLTKLSVEYREMVVLNKFQAPTKICADRKFRGQGQISEKLPTTLIQHDSPTQSP